MRKSIAIAYYPNAMIGKLEMGLGSIDFRHMTTYAVLAGYGARGRVAFIALCGFVIRKMTCQTLAVIYFTSFSRRLVWIMTGSASDATIGRITTALKHSIRLESDIVEWICVCQSKNVFDAAMTFAAQILRDIISIHLAKSFHLSGCKVPIPAFTK